jgi:voltage-gated potassium channel
MIAFFVIMWQSVLSARDIARDPTVRPLGVWLATLIVIGAVFYHNVESWGWLDAFYFTVITLATVGFGDLSPETDVGKLFTIFYVLAGIGILVAFVDATVQRGSDRRRRRRHRGQAVEEPERNGRADGDVSVS